MGKGMKSNKLLLLSIAIFCFFIGTKIANSQNLVGNGGFEQFIKFDDYDFGHKLLENNPTTWHNPTKARPEIYYDEKTAKSGAIFAGMHMIGISGYREYITTPLRCRLLPGEQYVLSFYVKLSENSEFAISSFGALLTEEPVKTEYTSRIKDTPQVFVDNTSFFDDKRAWQLVRDTFTAIGNESYLTIGNFLPDEKSVTKKVVLMAQQGKAYYYIDDIYLSPIGEKDPCRVLIDSSVCESVVVSELNIVPDPSFECFVECPSNINTEELSQLKYWKQTASGTPDYFNSCSIIMSAPENIMGSEKPKTGQGYVGLYMFDQGNYREYITAQFSQPLKKKQWYVVTVYVALSDNSSLATDAFEFLVTEKNPELELNDLKQWEKADGVDTAEARKILKEILKRDGNVIDKVTPQIINSPGNYATERTWQKICGVYLANGGEKFITMGNFNSDKETGLRKVGTGNNPYAYYYIDDFTFEPLTASNMSECGAGIAVDDIPNPSDNTPSFYQDLTIPQLLSGKPFTFEGFYFEFDKYDIIDSNYAFLDSLVEMMFDDERLNLKVIGHTDYVGSDRYNLKLSKNRALAVVNYLKSQGIEKERITYEYFGANKPIASNLIPEGRQKNRRVEFVLKRQ
ncbi:MAG: OmpA family protein [Bacteroidetes bacterium]|nr:OmpA family protein [Bacteroidota bacterium]